MNLRPVASESALQQRLRRFWNDGRKRKRGLLNFVENLNAVGTTAVFGGMIRDFARGGAVTFRSDVDLVVSTEDADHLDRFMRDYDSVPNRFGGHRVKLDFWLVDVWPAANTWAFNQGHVEGSELKDLTQTTFFNWDAAVFEINTSRLHLIDGYIKAVEQGNLDINLEVNPNPAGMVLRAWKMMLFFEASISTQLTNYICRSIDYYQDDLIRQYASKSKFNWVNHKSLDHFHGLLQKHLSTTPKRPFKLLPARQSSLFELLERTS